MSPGRQKTRKKDNSKMYTFFRCSRAFFSVSNVHLQYGAGMMRGFRGLERERHRTASLDVDSLAIPQPCFLATEKSLVFRNCRKCTICVPVHSGDSGVRSMCGRMEGRNAEREQDFQDSVRVCSHFRKSDPMVTNDAPIANDDPDVVVCVCVLVVIKSMVLACRYEL
jgi:hypothetical protein